MPAPDVAALLAELERIEPDVAESARAAVEWLTGGESLETISQLDVCEFLWYTLPIKVSGDRAHVARALGRLFRLGGMARYAALCDSSDTTRILRVYAREGEEAGTAAYQRALEATGVLPPNLDELAWSSIMGPEEMGAHAACAAALELAIVSGAPIDRETLTRRWLTTPRTELGGDCWLHRVHGERLNRWVLGRGYARRELAQPFEVRLHAPITPPEDPGLEPLGWLLTQAGQGIRLTERFNLPRVLVAEAVERFGWPRATAGAVRGEGDVPTLTTLRAIATEDLGMLCRTGRKLVLTPAGRALVEDPTALWRGATTALLTPARGEHEFEISVRESALMLIADGDAVSCDVLQERIVGVVNGEGWRSATGSQVLVPDLGRPLGELRRRLDALGLLVNGPSEHHDEWRLTAVGRLAVLTSLRTQALRPRRYAGLG
jgi:hypothetical protein